MCGLGVWECLSQQHIQVTCLLSPHAISTTSKGLLISAPYLPSTCQLFASPQTFYLPVALQSSLMTQTTTMNLKRCSNGVAGDAVDSSRVATHSSSAHTYKTSLSPPSALIISTLSVVNVHDTLGNVTPTNIYIPAAPSMHGLQSHIDQVFFDQDETKSVRTGYRKAML
jgi:hypothetical protein